MILLITVQHVRSYRNDKYSERGLSASLGFVPSDPTTGSPSPAYSALRDEESGGGTATVTQADAFRGAIDAFIAGPRLDMGRLASDLGIGKATLYRWTGSREKLLAEVLAYLSQRTFERARSETGHLEAQERILTVMRIYLGELLKAEPLRRFIQNETPLAFRLLTTRGGLPQGDIVRMLGEMLAYEHEAHGMALRTDPETLAFAIVRISEGYIYVDPVADIEPDIDAAIEIASLLVE